MTTRLRQVKALEEDLREYRSIQVERAWQQTWARCTQQKPVQPQRSWTAYLMRVAAILVLLAGHYFNIIINVLGAFVHSSRLQYIEFFGKFYEGGGQPFEPLAAHTKYYQISEVK